MCIAKLNIFYQHDATIINSNCLLFILKVLKAHFNILSLSHLCNKFCYSIIEPHHSLIFYLFFSLLNFSSHYLKKKKQQQQQQQQQQQKPPISSYLQLHFLQSFPFPLCLFTSPTTLYFTVTLSSLFFSSYNLTLLILILFCINLISFPPINPYFSHTKIMSTLSLSLSLFW